MLQRLLETKQIFWLMIYNGKLHATQLVVVSFTDFLWLMRLPIGHLWFSRTKPWNCLYFKLLVRKCLPCLSIVQQLEWLDAKLLGVYATSSTGYLACLNFPKDFQSLFSIACCFLAFITWRWFFSSPCTILFWEPKRQLILLRLSSTRLDPRICHLTRPSDLSTRLHDLSNHLA